MKTLLMAPRSTARTVAKSEATRLLASGSWLPVAPLARQTVRTLQQRAYTERCRAAGKRCIQVWLPGDVFGALHAARRENETLADVIARLVQGVGAGGNVGTGGRTDTDAKDADDAQP